MRYISQEVLVVGSNVELYAQSICPGPVVAPFLQRTTGER